MPIEVANGERFREVYAGLLSFSACSTIKEVFFIYTQVFWM